MRQAILSVRDGDAEALGLQEVVAAFRAADLRDVEVLSCEGPRGVIRADVGEPIDESELESEPEVVWVEEVESSADGTAYLLEWDISDSEDAIQACSDGLLQCATLDVDDDGVTVDLAGPQEAIRETVAGYDEAGADVGLLALEDYEGPERALDSLTERQREVLEVAFETGYFDVPRGASTGDVAAEFDVDDSTVAEHLQRAERNLLSSVLSRSA